MDEFLSFSIEKYIFIIFFDNHDSNTVDQITSIKDKIGNVLGNYEYGSNGLRSKKIVNGQTQHYYYSGDKLTYITDNSNDMLYSFARDANGRLFTMTDHSNGNLNGTTYEYVLNFRGDVLGLRDVSGNMVASYTYDSWGNILSSTGTKTLGNGKLLKEENPFRYASYVYDNETNLYYVNARYYDSEHGRFLTRDAVPYDNLYAYVGNNPISSVDPTGNSILSFLGEISGLNDAVNFVKNPNWENAVALATNIPILKPIKLGKVALKGSSAIANTSSKTKSYKNSPPPYGGSHGIVRKYNTGGEVHHTPAKAANRYVTTYSGPSIWMAKEDHKLTASHSSQLGSRWYIARQRSLIDNGRFMDAVEMDIQDIQSRFGNKYNPGIEQMKIYAFKLSVENPNLSSFDNF